MNLQKKLMTLMFGVGLLVMSAAQKASAIYTDAIMSNNTAQITITIRPNVDRSVTITTNNVNTDLGYLSLTGGFVSTQTVRPATVTVGGTYGTTDLLLSGNIAGGWNFDNSSSSIDADALATWVAFTSISSNTAPSQNDEYFFGEDGSEANSGLMASANNIFPARRVGTNSATIPGTFENNVTSMNSMALNTQRHMWMYFRMPGTTSTTNDQFVTFILTVDSGS